MTAHELLEWCKLRKTNLGLSNAKLAELSGTPKGTIDRLLSSDQPDFKYETIRPLIKVLVGGSFDGNPCPSPQQPEVTAPDPALVLQVHDLEKDLSFADKTISRLEDSLKSWKQAIYAVMCLCAFLSISLVGYILMDMRNTDIGLFREDFTSPAALLPILGVVAAVVAIIAIIGRKFRDHKKNT